MVFKERSTAQIPIREDRASKEASKASKTLERVRIDDIFALEFSIRAKNKSGNPYNQAETRLRYEQIINRVIGSVSDHIGVDWHRDMPEDIRMAINGADEFDLFRTIQRTLYDELNIGYKAGSSMASSVWTNGFNCYTGSVLVADALTRMGKPTHLLLINRHIQVAGERMTFNTAGALSTCISYRPTFERRNRDCEVLGAGNDLLAHTYSRCATALTYNKMIDEALEICNEGERLNPECTYTLSAKGYALSLKGNGSGAMDYYIRALNTNPYSVPALINLTELSIRMSAQHMVTPIVERVLAETPKYPTALYSKGLIEHSKGRWITALRLYHKAIRADRGYYGAWVSAANAAKRISPIMARVVLERSLKHVRDPDGRAWIRSTANNIGIRLRDEVR